jgi:hypothetical protein
VVTIFYFWASYSIIYIMSAVRENTIWEPIDFTIYIKLIKWPVFLALVLELVLRWWGNGFGAGFIFNQIEVITWIVRLSALGFIAYKSVQSFGHNTVIAAISGVLGGLAIGFLVSLFRFLDGITVWKLFNIITETTTVAVVGSLIAIFITYVSQIKK